MVLISGCVGIVSGTVKLRLELHVYTHLQDVCNHSNGPAWKNEKKRLCKTIVSKFVTHE